MSGAHLSGWPQPSRVMLEMLPGLGPPRSVFLNTLGFHGDSDGKESTCNLGDLGSIPGLGRSPGGGHGNPLQYSCLENPHGQRSLAGYSPWGHKESDTTERLNTAEHSTAAWGRIS